MGGIRDNRHDEISRDHDDVCGQEEARQGVVVSIDCVISASMRLLDSCLEQSTAEVSLLAIREDEEEQLPVRCELQVVQLLQRLLKQLKTILDVPIALDVCTEQESSRRNKTEKDKEETTR